MCAKKILDIKGIDYWWILILLFPHPPSPYPVSPAPLSSYPISWSFNLEYSLWNKTYLETQVSVIKPLLLHSLVATFLIRGCLMEGSDPGLLSLRFGHLIHTCLVLCPQASCWSHCISFFNATIFLDYFFMDCIPLDGLCPLTSGQECLSVILIHTLLLQPSWEWI